MEIRAPHRVSHRYTQKLAGPPAEVFPLLCPVRETEWVNGWRPSLVLSGSGVAEPECVFVTPGVPFDAVWVMTVHDPDRFRLELRKLVPDLVIGRITIALRATGPRSCEADVEYTYTSLGARGDEVLDNFTAKHFVSFMQTWEEELNHYLSTGERLPPR